MQKDITSRIRLEKGKLLTGELKKSDFSSEVFPRFARRGGVVLAISVLQVYMNTTTVSPLKIWGKGMLLFLHAFIHLLKRKHLGCRTHLFKYLQKASPTRAESSGHHREEAPDTPSTPSTVCYHCSSHWCCMKSGSVRSLHHGIGNTVCTAVCIHKETESLMVATRRPGDRTLGVPVLVLLQL